MTNRRIILIVSVVTVAGLIWAGLAAYRHVRRESNDKAIATYQIAAGLDQYFMENSTAVSVGYVDLIGEDKYIKAVNPVDGEDYHEFFPVRPGFRELAVTMGDGRRVILFDRKTIRQNADGSFPERYNPHRAEVEEYRRWIAAGRPPAK